MKIHYLQHVSFESPGFILEWAQERNSPVNHTPVYESLNFPQLGDFDLLVVMGGPMNIYEDHLYPWLSPEKEFIRSCIFGGKKVLGICLGAQLIADCLGARVYPGPYREIGWHSLKIDKSVLPQKLASKLPEELMGFHWHGDTFDIPAKSQKFAESEAFANQGFIYEERVFALQFHPEITLKGISDLCLNCGAEIEGSKYTEPAKAMLQRAPGLTQAGHQMMTSILEFLT
jgi:GMP synthase-like glutamine amidotransferase